MICGNKSTIRHCSMLEFRKGASNQAVAPGITRPLHATAWRQGTGGRQHCSPATLPKAFHDYPVAFFLEVDKTCVEMSLAYSQDLSKIWSAALRLNHLFANQDWWNSTILIWSKQRAILRQPPRIIKLEDARYTERFQNVKTVQHWPTISTRACSYIFAENRNRTPTTQHLTKPYSNHPTTKTQALKATLTFGRGEINTWKSKRMRSVRSKASRTKFEPMLHELIFTVEYTQKTRKWNETFA